MSVRVMTMVWQLKTETPSEKLVLLKLADWSNDDGDSIYPKKSTVASFTGLTERTVTTAINKFVSQGILAVTEQGGGRGRSTRYCINIEVLRAAIAEGRKPGNRFRVSDDENQETVSGFEGQKGEVDSLKGATNGELVSSKGCNSFTLSAPDTSSRDLTINDPSSTERVFVGIEDADCEAFGNASEKWLPANRERALAKGLRVRDLPSGKEAAARDAS